MRAPADPAQGLFPEGQAAPSMAQALEAEGTHRRLQVPIQKVKKMILEKKIESHPAFNSDVLMKLKGWGPMGVSCRVPQAPGPC